MAANPVTLKTTSPARYNTSAAAVAEPLKQPERSIGEETIPVVAGDEKGQALKLRVHALVVPESLGQSL